MAKECKGIFRTSGAYAFCSKNHGLSPVAKLCRRSAATFGCASRDILDSYALREGAERERDSAKPKEMLRH